MLTNPDSISAQVLKAVYFPEGNILTAVIGSRPSTVWRSICEGRDVLKLGVIRRIGDGKETQFFDNWLPRDHKLQPICARSATPPEFVSELINQTVHAWNIEAVREHMIPPDADVVLNIPLSSINLPDTWAWHYEHSGRFFVRSAYRLLVETK